MVFKIKNDIEYHKIGTYIYVKFWNRKRSAPLISFDLKLNLIKQGDIYIIIANFFLGKGCFNEMYTYIHLLVFDIYIYIYISFYFG